MGKLRAFYIELENPQGVFFAGQIVNGRLVVELDAEMKMREIRLTFKGLAYVHWTESHTTGTGSNRRTETRHYSATENYFNQCVPVFGRGMGMGDDNRLPPGQHVYPFSFQLPPNLPSSFEGGVGYVRYTIKGTIDKPWKFDHTTKRPFTIIALLDLNTQPNAASGTHNQQNKFLCCLCCKSGPITGMLRLDRVGYVPGEAITFQAEIQNMTSRVCGTHVKLSMTTIFHATSKSKTTSNEITRVNHPDIQPGDTENWSGDRLVIPPLPPSFLVGCRIIDINYCLELIVDPSGPAIDLHVPLLIIIGTIPLQSVVQQYQTQYGVSATGPPALPPPPGPEPSAPPMGGASPMMNLPPPSYSECVFGKTNIREEDDSEHTRGEMDYAPAYTYYDWSKQSQFK
ncbi:arrestin domain-containing protein 17-like isoform X2 [Ostrea edulis]|uniref:arrestin domain-containing protein 17-like isoform X2 n=1 Tax=Ostrea edulis TaxID=37623 RepID=UPI0024AF40DF|nr:arrestin domain-containing protein 17-like isoform X2 [Ostrea edulis]